MNMEEELKEHLRVEADFMRKSRPASAPSFAHTSLSAYVLAHGRVEKSQALVRDELAYLTTCVGSSVFPIKQCFANAQKLVMDSQYVVGREHKLYYVEGYVVRIGLGIPIQHGWAVLNGKVIDVTMRLEKPRPRGKLRDRVFGVTFNTTYLQKHAFKIKGFSPLIDDWQDGWPLLKNDPPDARLSDEQLSSIRRV